MTDETLTTLAIKGRVYGGAADQRQRDAEERREHPERFIETTEAGLEFLGRMWRRRREGE